MLRCSFKLNDEPMSILTVGPKAVAAFSGNGSNTNRRTATCLVGKGPLPVGDYYIFDRRIVGIRAHLRDAVLADQRDWFSLHAIDDNIDDDQVLCDHIRRSNFRLHPKGRLGRSDGCVTVDNRAAYQHVSHLLRSRERVAVKGSSFKAYGILSVS